MRWRTRPSVRRILFTGDLLRPGPASQPGWSNRFIAAFYASLGPILRSAVNVPVGRVLSEPGGFDQAGFYETLQRPFAVEEWLSLFSGDARLDPTAERLLIEPFEDALVIGYELPEVMRRAFENHGIPCIDLSFGPIQFMDDATVILRSRNRALMDRLCRFNLPDGMIEAAAGIVKATALWTPTDEQPPGPAVLFCASAPNARSLYGNGRYFSFLDFEDEVRALAADHRTVYFKPHPRAFCTAEEVAFFRTLPGIRFTTANIYWMMVTVETLETVVSLCSSVSLEARYFDKRGISLLRPSAVLLDGQKPKESYDDASVSVLYDVWSGQFWRTVLEPFVPLSHGGTVELPPKPNRLRAIFQTFGPATLIDLLPQQQALEAYQETQLRSVDREFPEDPALCTARDTVRRMYEAGDYGAVIDLVLATRQNFGDDATLLYFLALAKGQQGGSLDEAVAAMDRALALGFDRFWGHFQRAGLRLRTGDADGALSDLREADRICPNHAGVRRMIDSIRLPAAN